jgi:hypothetical protein
MIRRKAFTSPGSSDATIQGSKLRSAAVPRPTRRALSCCSATLALALLAALGWTALAAGALHAAPGHAAVPPLLRTTIVSGGRIRSGYGVEYWRATVNHTALHPGLLARARLRMAGTNTSCLALAQAHPEPFSPWYAPRGTPPPQVRAGTSAWQSGGLCLCVCVGGACSRLCGSRPARVTGSPWKGLCVPYVSCRPHLSPRAPARPSPPNPRSCQAARRARPGAGAAASARGCLNRCPSS